jgi:hypothetical protein
MTVDVGLSKWENHTKENNYSGKYKTPKFIGTVAT